MKEKSTRFENKLKAYSALAAGVTALAAVSPVQAQIVYTDVNPDRVLTAAAVDDTMNIDMDHNGTNDFYFSLRTYGTANVQANLIAFDGATAQVLGTNVQINSTGSYGYGVALALNDPIAAGNPNWQVTCPQWILASVYNGTNYGNFGDSGEHYLGVYFSDGTNTYYGWIRVTGLPIDGATCTVMDYAYNSTPNDPINAGQMTVGIKDANELDAKVYSHNKNLYVNVNKVEGGVVNVYNGVGQLVKSVSVDNNKMVINMNEVASGIYNVNVVMDGKTLTKKVSL